MTLTRVSTASSRTTPRPMVELSVIVTFSKRTFGASMLTAPMCQMLGE